MASQQEFQKNYERLLRLTGELERGVESLCDTLNISPKELSNLLDNPSNFRNEKQWQNMQSLRKSFLDDLSQRSGISFEQRSLKSSDDLSKKKRQGKTLGARKKWISM